MNSNTSIDVTEFIDSRNLGRYQILVIALCFLVVFVDGFDVQAIGYVAPALLKTFNVNKLALGPVFSAGLFGMALGALSFGPIADRFGRRPVLLFCTLSFAVMSLLTSTVDSIQGFMWVRFFTGLGLGGVMPNAIAITSEYSPQRARSTAVMIMFCGFSLGAALGGVVAAGIIPVFGWQSVFIAGAALPCVVFLLLLAFLPESVRYLVLNGTRNHKVQAILQKMDSSYCVDPAVRFIARESVHKNNRIKQLFLERRAKLTLLLWVIFFMSLLELYFLSNWLPTIIGEVGIESSTAIMIAAGLQIGGTVGTLLLGRLFDKVPPFKALSAIYLSAALFVVLISVAGSSISLLAFAVFGTGFCVVGGQIGANALTATAYPTAIRATGVGWALGIGRIGSICGPLIGAALLSFHWEMRHVFLLSAVPVAVAAIAALALSKMSGIDRD